MPASARRLKKHRTAASGAEFTSALIALQESMSAPTSRITYSTTFSSRGSTGDHGSLKATMRWGATREHSNSVTSMGTVTSMPSLAVETGKAVPRCTKSKVWLNDGSGDFSEGWSGGTPSVATVALGDLDNDGDLDVFLGKIEVGPTPPSEIWLNDGQGNFSDSGQRLRDASWGLALGDIDSDGDLDAVSGNVLVDGSKVWLNDGTGRFSDSGQRLAPTCWSPDVALGDVDGDSDLDAWVACGSSGHDGGRRADVLFLNDGTGKFVDSQQSVGQTSTFAVELEDLDGDGDLDAFVVHGDQRGGNLGDEVYFNDGTGQFTVGHATARRVDGSSVGIGGPGR